MENVVIVDGCRTAVGKMGGGLKPLSAYDMACAVLRASWTAPRSTPASSTRSSWASAVRPLTSPTSPASPP